MAMLVSLEDFNARATELARQAGAGEVITVTDRGQPIAELRPHGNPRQFARRQDVVRAFASLPRMDYAELRANLDAVADPYSDDPYER